MPPAPTTFVQLCRTNNIAAVPANQRLQFLRDAATLASEGLSAKSLTERCAALSWARDSLQNSVDPDTWPTLLTPALYAYLQGLYTIPPYKGAPPKRSQRRPTLHNPSSRPPRPLQPFLRYHRRLWILPPLFPILRRTPPQTRQPPGRSPPDADAGTPLPHTSTQVPRTADPMRSNPARPPSPTARTSILPNGARLTGAGHSAAVADAPHQ